MSLLEGQAAFITGGGSGIGRATARLFAQEGARVAVADIVVESAKEVADEIGGLAYDVDVTDADSFATAVGDAAEKMGRLSIMFNNAGGGSILGSLHEYTVEQWDGIIRLNLTGVFNGFRAAVPYLLKNGSGSIVSTASISGTRPAAGEAAYSAAKAGVIALTAVAALEYAPAIRVNAISPGSIDTAMTTPMWQVPGERERAVEKTPLRRIGQPEDIARVVTFLCSDLARFVTGQNIVIDGGMTLHGSVVDGVLAYLQSAMRGEPPRYS